MENDEKSEFFSVQEFSILNLDALQIENMIQRYLNFFDKWQRNNKLCEETLKFLNSFEKITAKLLPPKYSASKH